MEPYWLNAANPGRKNCGPITVRWGGWGTLISKSAVPDSLHTVGALSGGVATESNVFSAGRIYPQQTMPSCLENVLSAAMQVNTLGRFEPKH